MSDQFYQQIKQQLVQIEADGLFKNERIITTSQDADIEIQGGQRVINFCANNYLGLANHPALIEAAKQGMDSHGFWDGVGAFYLWNPRQSQSTRKEIG
ncbi:2-amino-3-ketobutyrate coenzyme A ligase [Providencia rustigianii]|nr:2-amino-3-ketobutyrate coenzyme A ligase [Providencia rustigianii]